MNSLTQRLLSCSLATAYAVLALFGGALHDCSAAPAATGEAGSCIDCCCHAHGVAEAPATEAVGWSSDRPSTDRAHDSCAICRALAQLKLGKTSLPTSLPGVSGALISRVGSDGCTPSVQTPTHPGRGPPSALLTV